MKRAGLAGADAHQPDRAGASERQPQQGLRAHEPGSAAKQGRLAPDVGAQEDIAIGAQEVIDQAGAQQVNAGQRQPGCPRRRALDAEGDDIGIDQHRKVGGDDLQEMLKAGGFQHPQRRLVHAALAGEVAAAQRDQVFVRVLNLFEIAAQAFEHEMLKVEHAVAAVAAGGAQQMQSVGMPFEKIGIFPQIGDDVGGLRGAGLARRRLGAAEPLWLVVRKIGHR